MFNQNQFIMKKLFTLFAAMVTFVALNAQTVDYYMMGFAANHTDQQPTMLEQINLGMNEDLNPNAVLMNLGPDVPNPADTVAVVVYINNNAYSGMMLPSSYTQQLVANSGIILYTQDPLLTADDMEGLTSFELCYVIGIFGTATDPDESNNTACITVNRGATDIFGFAEGEVNVYPNPATTVINIDNAEGAQVSVFDINGRMISNVESASANQTIDASNFAKGMYIVRIANGNNVITKKISVVR